MRVCRSVRPFVTRNAAALDDRSHGAERENAASMLRNDHLLSRGGMAPLLMASGNTNPNKAVSAENSDYLI